MASVQEIQESWDHETAPRECPKCGSLSVAHASLFIQPPEGPPRVIADLYRHEKGIECQTMKPLYATYVAGNVLAELDCILDRAPILAKTHWQVFYISKGVLVSAFMEDDCVTCGDQL